MPPIPAGAGPANATGRRREPVASGSGENEKLDRTDPTPISKTKNESILTATSLPTAYARVPQVDLQGTFPGRTDDNERHGHEP